MSGLEKSVDKTIAFIFSKDNRKYLIPIMILGFILRILIAFNYSPQVADEMVHGPNAIGISHSGVISEQNECPVWFYMTDIAYRIIGVNSFSARFLSFFYGLLSILMLYVIARKISGSEKVALISSFLLAISVFYTKFALIAMDEMMMFFVLLSFYYFIIGMESKKVSYLSILFMALATLTKPIALTFVPSFVIYFIYLIYQEKDALKRKEFIQKNIKRIILGAAMFVLFASPVLVYNYLLYNEKGITDIIFARFFGVSREIYKGFIGFDATFSLGYAIDSGPNFLWVSFFALDPIITILGIAGFFLVYKTDKRLAKFFLLFHLINFIFLLGTSQLHTHFAIFMVPLCFAASYSVIKISDYKIFGSLGWKKRVLLILSVIFFVGLYMLWPYIISQSAVFKARDFAIKNIQPADVIVSDSRIYTGRTVFMFHDKHYIDLGSFPQILQQSNNMTGQEVPTTVYFMECVPDDCGWGSIGNQPDLNKSLEGLWDFVKNNSVKVTELPAGGGDLNEPGAYFIIYKMVMPLKAGAFQLIDSTHNWFFYPVMWKGERYDSYKLDTASKKLLHNTAYIFLWIAIFIAILSPAIAVYEVARIKKEEIVKIENNPSVVQIPTVNS